MNDKYDGYHTNLAKFHSFMTQPFSLLITSLGTFGTPPHTKDSARPTLPKYVGMHVCSFTEAVGCYPMEFGNRVI